LLCGSAQACDEFASNLLKPHLAQAISALGCSELGRAGLDQADHKLEKVCYASTGPTSSVEIVASLRCHTSSAALLPASVSERVGAEAIVLGSDCTVQGIKLKPSGEIGKILSAALGLNGLARNALQNGLNQLCAKK
jgi:hypothetical protein